MSVLSCVNDYERYKKTERKYKDLAYGDIAFTFYYNEGDLGLAKVYNDLATCDGDILVFTHQDAYPLEEGWDEKIESYLKGEVGVVGFAGSDSFPHNGMWWAYPTRYGSLSQGGSPLTFEGKMPGYVEVLDGFCFAVRREVVNEFSFDEKYPSIHLVCEDFCLEVWKKWAVMVIPLMMMHLSSGETNSDDWRRSYEIFKEKWRA